MMAVNSASEPKSITIPFSSADEAWAFYKYSTTKYQIDPFYYKPNGESVDNILDKFKTEFISVSTKEEVLANSMAFFRENVVQRDWEDFTTDSDESNQADSEELNISEKSTHFDMNIDEEKTDDEHNYVTMDKNDGDGQSTEELTEEIKQEFLAADENTICKIPFAALEAGRTDIIDICAKSGFDLNMFRSPSGHNLLMKYVSYEIVNEEMLDYLLARKIDVNINDPLRSHTALFISLVNRNIDPAQKLSVVRKLLYAGSKMTTIGRFYSTALHTFIYELLNPIDKMQSDNWQDIIEELLKAGVDINAQDYSESTPLLLAISRIAPEGEVPDGMEPTQFGYDVVEYLLKRGADPDIKDGDGRTSLYNSALSQNLTLLNILIKSTKHPDLQDNLGMNSIYGICAYSEWTTGVEEIYTILFPTFDALTKGGCSLNAQAVDKSTVLHHAAATQSHLVCQKLCLLGADVNIKDYLQRTPLHMAIRNKDTKVVDVLVSHGACVDSKAKHDESPLHHACLLENIDAAKALIAAGADIEAQTVLGVRPIHLTAENGDTEFIQYMTQRSDKNATDIYGANAVHYAAADGNIEALEYLLKVNCDRNKRDKNGNTPLDLALYTGHLKVSERLCAPHKPRFGNLPFSCFPNRPLIDEEDVEQFYNDLVDKFKHESKSPIDIAKDILDSNGFGRVHLDRGEGKLISDLLVKYAENIAARISELDPLFSCSLLRAGSTYEGVKTGYPDEFDFLCNLTELAKHVETIEEGGTEGYVFILLKESAPAELFRFCPRGDRRISGSHILRYFSKLSRVATYEILSKMNFGGHIYAGYMLLPESNPLFTTNVYPLSKLNAQTVSFRGKLHKLLDISIDFNPVVFTNGFPKEALQSCNVVHDVASRGIYCLPKLCRQVTGLNVDGRSIYDDLWRLSTQHIEAEAIRSMSSFARDCYILCKIFRMEPLSCSLKYLEAEELNEEDLMKLMPSGGDLDDGMVSDEHSSEANNTNGVVYHRNNTSSYQTTVGVKNETLFENDSEEVNATCGSVEITCSNGGYQYAEAELTAEKLIPSYYIKSIFIKEMDKIMHEGKELSERSLLEIPKKVYRQLLKAIEESYLTTLFMPEHNMLKKAINTSTSELETRMRETYCRKIIWLMDQLNF